MKHKWIWIAVALLAGCIQDTQPEKESELCEAHPEIYNAIKEYPWVEWAVKKQTMPEVGYIEDLCFLADVDPGIAYRIAYSQWITDYISQNEEKYLKMIVDMARYNPSVAAAVADCWWVGDDLKEKEIETVEYVYDILMRDSHLAVAVVSCNWFKTFVTSTELAALHLVRTAPLEYAAAVVKMPWFHDFISHTEVEAMKELETFYTYYPQYALQVLELESFATITTDNVVQVRRVNTLVQKDAFLFELLEIEPLTINAWRCWSGLSALAGEDAAFAVSIRERLTDVHDKEAYAVENLALLFLADRTMVEYLDENGYLTQFTEEGALFLRFCAVLLSFEDIKDYEAVITTAAFASHGIVYEDRFEQYRYHLLWKVFPLFGADTLEQYQSVLKVSLEIYAERFYKWKLYTSELLVLSDDEFLNDLELTAFTHLLTYFTEQDLVTDVTQLPEDELYYLLDVPYQYFVNVDGTITPIESVSSPLMRGSAAVFATAYNIFVLEDRKTTLMNHWEDTRLRQKHLQDRGIFLLEFIVKEGDFRDQLFVFISGKNWESPTEEACICHTYQSIMDLKSVGIPSTIMYWHSGESAHVYPAYIPGEHVLTAITEDPKKYDNPFVYKGFISPWDKAGYKKLKPRDIVVIQAYDRELQLVTIWSKPDSILQDPKNIVVIIILVGGFIFVMVKVAQHFFAMRLT